MRSGGPCGMADLAKAQTKAKELLGKLQKGDDDTDLTREFLSYGSSVPDGLIQACLGNRASNVPGCPNALEILLDNGGNVHAKDPLGLGPAIHSACWRGGPDVVKVLLTKKADIDAKDAQGMPPLNTAISAGNAKACLELLNSNASVQWTHSDGATALHVYTAWVASSHNSKLRAPPVGEEPVAVVSMLLHNGVDPTQTEGMSKGGNRARGLTPLEGFRQEIARSPWRGEESLGRKFDKTAKAIHKLLEMGEEAVKLKQEGNKAFTAKPPRYEEALKKWQDARKIWDLANIRGHHMAVLWNNEATCQRRMGNMAGCRQAAEEGRTHWSEKGIQDKLANNLELANMPEPEPSEEEKARRAEAKEKKREELREKARKQKEEFRELSKQATLEADGDIYGEEGSGQKDYVIPPTFICPMEQAQDMGLGPPPPPRPWWEEKEADSDEEPPRTWCTYLPAHHPKW